MVRFITRDGLKKIQDELDERKSVVRQRIAKEIKEAKEQGDLSENAEYSEAKNKQSENESRIAEIEMIIKNSEIAEEGQSNGNGVGVGSKVKVKYDGSEIELHIVGSNEADPSNFKISNESPMGRAFIGKDKGDSVMVETPMGKIKYKILDVQ